MNEQEWTLKTGGRKFKIRRGAHGGNAGYTLSVDGEYDVPHRELEVGDEELAFLLAIFAKQP